MELGKGEERYGEVFLESQIPEYSPHPSFPKLTEVFQALSYTSKLKLTAE